MQHTSFLSIMFGKLTHDLQIITDARPNHSAITDTWMKEIQQNTPYNSVFCSLAERLL